MNEKCKPYLKMTSTYEVEKLIPRLYTERTWRSEIRDQKSFSGVISSGEDNRFNHGMESNARERLLEHFEK